MGVDAAAVDADDATVLEAFLRSFARRYAPAHPAFAATVDRRVPGAVRDARASGSVRPRPVATSSRAWPSTSRTTGASSSRRGGGRVRCGSARSSTSPARSPAPGRPTGWSKLRAMAFPRRLLIEGEELVLDLRPHWVALVGPILVTLLVIAGWVVALTYAPGDGTGRTTDVCGARSIVGALVLLWYPLRAIVAWATSNFAVTTDRIIHREGFIAKRTMEIPLEAINDIRFQQSVFERIVGAGDIIIQSASEFGRNVFADIPDPEGVQRTIYLEGERNKDRMYKGDAAGPRGARGALGHVRARAAGAELRRRGVLTDAEFQDQKRRILGDA